MKIQTRSEENGLAEHDSWEAAFDAAEKDPTIWKISWNEVPEGRVRLVRVGNCWQYEPVDVD